MMDERLTSISALDIMPEDEDEDEDGVETPVDIVDVVSSEKLRRGVDEIKSSTGPSTGEFILMFGMSLID